MRLSSATRLIVRKLLDLTVRGESRPVTSSLAIFLLAFCVRLTLLVVTETWPDVQNYELVHVAWSIARGDGFSNPFLSGNTGPTAHVAPVYPYFLAAIYNIYGFINFADLVKQLLACATSSLIFALLPSISQVAGIPRRMGVVGGVIGALTPMSIDVEVIGRWETHIATLLFGIAILCWLRDFGHDGLTWRRGIISGLLWGLLLLTSPSFITVLFALIILVTVERRLRSRRALSYVLVLVLVAAAVLIPWTVRNWRTFGAFVFVRDNAGLEFYLSNLPGSRLMMGDNLLGGPGGLHPYGSSVSRRRIQQIGEVAFSRECSAKFIEGVKADPGAFARRVLRRVLWMWFPVSDSSVRDSMLPRDLIAGCITLMGFLGLYWLPGDLLARKVFAVALISYPLVYYLVQASMRYRLPIVWITCLLCGNALVMLVQRIISPSPSAA